MEKKRKNMFIAVVGLAIVLFIVLISTGLIPLTGFFALQETQEPVVREGEREEKHVVELLGAETSAGSIVLRISASQEIGIGIITILDEEGNSLCGKNIRLKEGVNDYEVQCQIQRNVTVMLLPEGQKSIIKEFELKMQGLEFRQGMRYSYAGMNTVTNIYVMEETDSLWRGIIAIILDGREVAFNKFELDKEILFLQASELLEKEEIALDAVMMPGFVNFVDPMAMQFFQQQFGFSVPRIIEQKQVSISFERETIGEIRFLGETTMKGIEAYHFEYFTEIQDEKGEWQPVSFEVFTSTEKPYLVISIKSIEEILSLEKAEEKQFSLNEYAGFELYEQPADAIELVKEEVFADGQINIYLKNNLEETLFVEYLVIEEQVLETEIELLPLQVTEIPMMLGFQAEPGQRYQVPVIAGIHAGDPEYLIELTILLSGEVKEA